MTSRAVDYSSRDKVPQAGTFDQATLILYSNEKRINQKELVYLIMRMGSWLNEISGGFCLICTYYDKEEWIYIDVAI